MPMKILCNIKFIITDDIPQEFSQVDNTIEKILLNDRMIRCEWHNNTQGFEKHVNTKFPDPFPSLTDQHKKSF